MLVLAFVACTALAAFGLRANTLMRPGAGEAAERVARAERALAAGRPESALAITEGIAKPPPRLLLVRGKALVAIGDTSGGAAELRQASAHPAATAADALAAARVLSSWRSHANSAADAYVQAFAAGLPEAEWLEVMDALRRAGREPEADRVAELLRTR